VIWPYLIVGALTLADAFLSLMPNETALTAFAALGVSTGSPNVVLLGAVAAASAILGDVGTYLVGRKVGANRFRWMRSPRAVAAINWASSSLENRAGPVIVVARYIPFAKFAVSLTAGATGFRFRRYLPRVVLSCVIWAGYHSMIGVVFGASLRDNPALAVVLASIVGTAIGLVLDRATAQLERRRLNRVSPGTDDADGK
jgi:membrane-associated protein